MPQTITLKRSTTPNGTPTTLEVGEVAFNIVDDPVKGWIGTPVGVKLFAGGAGGAQVIIAPIAPTDVPANSLWWDSSEGRLYILYQESWVEIP